MLILLKIKGIRSIVVSIKNFKNSSFSFGNVLKRLYIKELYLGSWVSKAIVYLVLKLSTSILHFYLFHIKEIGH